MSRMICLGLFALFASFSPCLLAFRPAFAAGEIQLFSPKDGTAPKMGDGHDGSFAWKRVNCSDGSLAEHVLSLSGDKSFSDKKSIDVYGSLIAPYHTFTRPSWASRGSKIYWKVEAYCSGKIYARSPVRSFGVVGGNLSGRVDTATLMGYVYDAKLGVPIYRAMVYWGAVFPRTSSRGFYNSVLDPGTATTVCKSKNYYNSENIDVEVGNGIVRELDFRLEPLVKEGYQLIGGCVHDSEGGLVSRLESELDGKSLERRTSTPPFCYVGEAKPGLHVLTLKSSSGQIEQRIMVRGDTPFIRDFTFNSSNYAAAGGAGGSDVQLPGASGNTSIAVHLDTAPPTHINVSPPTFAGLPPSMLSGAGVSSSSLVSSSMVFSPIRRVRWTLARSGRRNSGSSTLVKLRRPKGRSCKELSSDCARGLKRELEAKGLWAKFGVFCEGRDEASMVLEGELTDRAFECLGLFRIKD